MTSESLLDRVTQICLALPETGCKLSHGAPAFSVAGKMFAYFSDNHHNDGRIAVLVKTSGVEEQQMLIEADPDLYFRPPYIGPSGWIGIRLDQGEPDWDHVGDRIAQSWELAAPRRLLEAGGR
jgi:phosphoribosylglycinamide formyltransferase-1/phosphoribosylamine--glycine ligase/phosphoribosylglycinamide formyltransferase/phosphoribosylformylglycinamidine cyclo-ligase